MDDGNIHVRVCGCDDLLHLQGGLLLPPPLAVADLVFPVDQSATGPERTCLQTRLEVVDCVL